MTTGYYIRLHKTTGDYRDYRGHKDTTGYYKTGEYRELQETK